MIANANYEHDCFGIYDIMDFGGECGVLNETMLYVPAQIGAKFRYSTAFGVFYAAQQIVSIIGNKNMDWYPF